MANFQKMSHDLTTAEFWNQQAAAVSTRYWADYPLVRSHVNRSVTDAWWAYPTHGFKAAWAYQPLARGLSLGCGTGLLERDLRLLRICEAVDAYDISAEAIRLARQRADEEHLDHVHFEVADSETIAYPADRYDAVFFHGSMHHMTGPAALLDRLLPALKPEGLLFLDDYVGPSRDEWKAEHLAHAARVYAELPPQWRTVETLLPPFDPSDPSEMVRSSAILPAIRSRFDLLWERPYWGNLLFPVLSQVDDQVASRPESEPILRMLIEREEQLVREGAFAGPLFVWLVGRKRPR